MKYICMYADYLNILKDLSDVRRGRLMLAVMEYAFCGEVAQLRGEERLAYRMICSQIDRDREKYDETCQRNRANGSKGGRPRKKAAAEDENPGVSEKPKEKEKKKEKKNKKENINDRENENESSSSGCGDCADAQPEHHTPQGRPTLEIVKQYCLDHQLRFVDPEKFYDYYSANGWRMGHTAMVDWQAALRNWNRKDDQAAHQNVAYEDPVYTQFKRQYGVMDVPLQY